MNNPHLTIFGPPAIEWFLQSPLLNYIYFGGILQELSQVLINKYSHLLMDMGYFLLTCLTYYLLGLLHQLIIADITPWPPCLLLLSIDPFCPDTITLAEHVNRKGCQSCLFSAGYHPLQPLHYPYTKYPLKGPQRGPL